jgi:hypothetical protein
LAGQSARGLAHSKKGAPRKRLGLPQWEYKPPFKFSGILKRVIVDLSGEQVADHETELKVMMAKQ